MADSKPWLIGKRRWRVRVVLRAQVAGADGAGIDESYTDVELVWANIQPIGPMALWSTAQTDTPVTHRIYTRWLDYLDDRHALLRETRRTDGSLRREVFRVRRVLEDDGRKRYSLIEAELETLLP